MAMRDYFWRKAAEYTQRAEETNDEAHFACLVDQETENR